MGHASYNVRRLAQYMQKQWMEVAAMIRGAIKTMDILRHPMIVIGVFGLFGFLRILAKCMSPSKYLFLNIMPK